MHQIALRYTTNFIFSFFLMLREDCYMDRKGLYFEKHFYIQIKFLYSEKMLINRDYLQLY